MAPNFAGFDDHHSICKLNTMAMATALRTLVSGGNLVMKTLSGTSESDAFVINSP